MGGEVTGNTCFPVRTDVAVGVQRFWSCKWADDGVAPRSAMRRRDLEDLACRQMRREGVSRQEILPRGCVVEDFEMAQLVDWRDVDT